MLSYSKERLGCRLMQTMLEIELLQQRQDELKKRQDAKLRYLALISRTLAAYQTDPDPLRKEGL